MYSVRQWSSFILLHIPVHFSISLIDHTVLSLLYTLSCLTVNSLTVCVSSVQLFSRVRLFVTPWTAAHQASLSITNSQSLLKLMSTESVMPSNHLILCSPLLLLPSIFHSIRVFSNELALHIRWPKYWSFSLNISPSNEHPGLISFRMDWLDLLASKGLSKVFSNTTVQKHQFFSVHLIVISSSLFLEMSHLILETQGDGYY